MEPSSYRYCSRCFAPIATGLTICGECSGSAVEGPLPAPPELLHLRHTFRRQRRAGYAWIGISVALYAVSILLVMLSDIVSGTSALVIILMLFGPGVAVFGCRRLMEGKGYRAAVGLWSLAGPVAFIMGGAIAHPDRFVGGLFASLLPTVALLFVPDRSERKIAELQTDKMFDT